jgi:uncharacterized protein YbjT (DUF2867 family)
MVVVTGARGNVGQRLVGELLRAGVEVRAVGRTQGVSGDLTRPASLAPALEGADALYVPIAAGDVSRPVDLGAVMELAVRAGVRKVVLVSSMLAERVPPLLQAEQIVRDSGLAWTILRPWEFASNVMAWVPSIQAEGVVRVPGWERPSPAIHPADIASVAFRALTGDHGGEIYPLTGPEELTAADKVRALEEASGRDIQLVLQDGPAPDELSAKVSVPGVCGVDSPGVLSTVQRVTGAPARTFVQWAHEHAGAFRIG